jgi:hypothetical protein
MLAKVSDNVPAGDLLYEPKWDASAPSSFAAAR